MATRSTIDDVARAAGVSVATVSRALRGLPNVAPATAERVRRAAFELDYETDPAASSLASGRTNTIGLIAPWFGTWYANRIVSAAERLLADAGYDLLLGSVRGPGAMEHFGLRHSYRRRIDGALLIDLFACGAELERLEAMNVPAVSVGVRFGSFPSITIDNSAAAEVATDHLLDLGHTRIALVGGDRTDSTPSPVPSWRRDGYRRAHERAGVEIDPALDVDGGFTTGGGAAATRRLLDLDARPTAIFYMSDLMAIGGLVVAAERGVEVPTGLSVIGFDDHELSTTFGLTTVRQDVDELGRSGAEMLLELLAGRPGRHIVGSTELTVRTTTTTP